MCKRRQRNCSLLWWMSEGRRKLWRESNYGRHYVQGRKAPVNRPRARSGQSQRAAAWRLISRELQACPRSNFTSKFPPSRPQKADLIRHRKREATWILASISARSVDGDRLPTLWETFYVCFKNLATHRMVRKHHGRHNMHSFVEPLGIRVHCLRNGASVSTVGNNCV